MDAAGMDPYWSAELIDAPAGWEVARGPGRRLLGGGLDLTAEENQVYLFLLMFGTLLFAVPPLVKCVHIIKAMRAHSKHGHRVEDEDEDALWDFQDQYDDLKNVHDPLDGDARDKRKKRRERR